MEDKWNGTDGFVLCVDEVYVRQLYCRAFRSSMILGAVGWIGTIYT